MTKNTLMTVADLKALLNSIPDDTTLWVFDAEDVRFFPVQAAIHDKRANGVNLWIKEDWIKED